MLLLLTVLSRSRDHTETLEELKTAFRPSRPVEDWLCLRPLLSTEFSHTERLKLPRLRLRSLDRRTSHTIRGKIADMKLEVLSLVLRLDCLSCVLTVSSTILVGRRCWEGWVLAAANSLIICVIGLRTAQLGFIPANLFCIVLYAVNLRTWRKAEIS
jgi:hypothetical protein